MLPGGRHYGRGIARVGVGLAMRKLPYGCSVDSMRFHRSNVVICEVVYGRQLTPLIGSYLTPPTREHLLDLEEALNQFPGKDYILIGYFNADIRRL